MKSVAGIVEIARVGRMDEASFLSVWGGNPPALTFNHREQGGCRVLTFLGLLEPWEGDLKRGRFVNYSAAPQDHAVDIEMPQYDYDDLEPVCPCVFDWLKECRGAWSLSCSNSDINSMMIPCTFTFEDENSALEFKLTFG